MSIAFHQEGPEENGITPYEVVLDKEYTVSEFVDEILKKRSYDKGIFYVSGWDGCTEYAYGHTRYGWRIPYSLKPLKVKSVKAQVRWSQIDYYIEAGDVNESEQA